MLHKKYKLSLLSLALISAFTYAEEQLEEIQVSANSSAEQSQQGFNTSVVSAKEIAKQPVVNDIAELVRMQPGVNFTSGNSNGSYGNKRQIDIRSMGPENTLILIDGKPATSRNSARYGRFGARDTHGDSKWVPVEEIDSVEVIRGTSAARYGSGAMGGVVNIKTKPVTNELKGGLSYYLNLPEDSKYGTTNRSTFNLSGPLIKDVLGFRLYGSWSKTRADSPSINENSDSTWSYAGREGLRNKDIAGRLDWNITSNQTLTLDASYSRQGNIYSGDSESWGANESEKELAGRNLETNRVYRQAYSLTHKGKWSWGENETYIAFDKTTNARLPVGLGFAMEGHWNGGDLNFTDSDLTNTRFSNELRIPFTLGAEHLLTIGMEANHSKLNDPSSMGYNLKNNKSMNLGIIPWLQSENRSGKTSLSEYGVFIEDMIDFGQGTVITPSVRFDHHSVSGGNWTPSLNLSQEVNPYLTLKGGIARAYKAPNLYQITEGYVLANRQNNCPATAANIRTVGACYTIGTKDLKPETSVNKEIGFELHNQDGYKFGLTYFHNDYRNKIEADETLLGTTFNPSFSRVTRYGTKADQKDYIKTTNIYKWGNVTRATVAGFEGYLNLPLIANKLSLNTNFTYFTKSKNRATGNPLNLSPKYTISSTLSYQVTDNLDFATTYTRFGKQFSKSTGARYMDFSRNGLAQDTTLQESQGSYGIWGASIGYKWQNFSARIGVSNILNKRLYVDGKAQSYNEPGRAYYTTLKYSF